LFFLTVLAYISELIQSLMIEVVEAINNSSMLKNLTFGQKI